MKYVIKRNLNIENGYIWNIEKSIDFISRACYNQQKRNKETGMSGGEKHAG